MHNLLHPLPNDRSNEVFTPLIHEKNLRIERIVSDGHTSPEGFWYDQTDNEWVLLLEGEAEIEYANGNCVHLHRGDALNLPAHTPHRVRYTSRPAIWLAVHYAAVNVGEKTSVADSE